MDAILTCFGQQHDWRLLALAATICVVSLTTASGLYERARGLARRARRSYLVTAPAVAGVGVWATHFTAMIAYDPGLPIAYEPVWTIVSLAIVVLGFSVALNIAMLDRSTAYRAFPAVISAAGVIAMHYAGMAAVQLEGARLAWSPLLVFVSVTGAFAFGFAVPLMRRFTGMGRVVLSALVGSAGVLWLHLSGMAALTVRPDPTALLSASAVSPMVVLIGMGVCTAGLVVAAAFLTGMAWWSRYSALGQIREAIEAMPDGLGLFDADDRLAIWNDRYAAVTPEISSVLQVGMSFHDILEVGLRQGLYPDAVGREAAWIRERMANRRRPSGAIEIRVAGGRWLRIQDRHTSEGGIVTVCSDITDLKAAADVLAQARDAAEAANRAKSQFLANMSHEIRTPLNGVIGVAQALARTDLTDQQREMLDLIDSSSRTLQTLLSDILDLARVESGRLELNIETMDLGKAVEEAAQLYAAAARDKGLQFLVDIAPAARCWVRGDVVRIKQVLTNLVSNAVKFTASGFVSLTADAGPRGFRFVVQDTGIGFDAATRDRLFHRFEQADGEITRRYGGSGLGLSICRELAAMMGGALDCESEPGGGAAFILTLPLTPAKAPESHAGATASPAVERALRILVADDHPTNRRVVELILDQDNVELISVEDGAQAVVACQAGAFDLVLMDMQMPVMDGLTATREIRLHEVAMGAPRTPIVMLTANALPEHIAAGLEAGADRHLAKPFDVAALLALVHELTASTAQAAEAAA